MKELDELIEITGVEPSSCSCKECRQMCKSSPCLGTPTDILNIVRKGYYPEIVYTKWGAGIKQNIPPITVLAPYYDTTRHCCSFMDAAKKNCLLHDQDLKPTGGRLMHHSLGQLGVKMGVNLPVDHAVALTWLDDDNAPVIMQILNEIREQKGLDALKPKTDDDAVL